MIYANKKNGQIKHQTDMTQTRLSKTNIWVNWVKDHVQACELDSGVIEKNCVLFRKCPFCFENGESETKMGIF